MEFNKKIADFATIKHGYAFEGQYFSEQEKEYILLTPGNFHIDQKLYFGKNTKFYSGPISEEYILENGSLLIVMTDLTKEMAILGNAVILKSKKPVLHNQRIGLINLISDNADKDYLCYLLNSTSVRNEVKATASGTTVRHTSPSKILNVKAWFPPLAEQKKIAEILSTWDKAIETVEKLIANSQQQKKSLMQQLLTGQKRLLDDNGVKFGDEWEEKSIKSILTISKGQQLNRDTLNTTSVYPVINGGIVPSGYTDDFNTNANTITISEGGNSCGYVSFQKTDFWCGGHCYALKKLKLNLEFTYHLLKFNEIQIMRLRVGSGLPNIQKKDLENLEVSFPTNSHEQEKIAQVLTLADQEIELYQQQLDKLKLEKKALMQQLLTGQKRVTVN